MQLVTPQTGPEGKKVNKVLVAQDVYYTGESETKEFYMSVLLDRGSGRNIVMYSTEGGMDIEEVDEKTPELIFKERSEESGVGKECVSTCGTRWLREYIKTTKKQKI